MNHGDFFDAVDLHNDLDEVWFFRAGTPSCAAKLNVISVHLIFARLRFLMVRSIRRLSISEMNRDRS